MDQDGFERRRKAEAKRAQREAIHSEISRLQQEARRLTGEINALEIDPDRDAKRVARARNRILLRV